MKMPNVKGLFLEKYKNVLQAASEGEQRCLDGKRWNGNILLIIVDTALDSIGLNYFKVVVPRVRKFFQGYVKAGEIYSIEALSKLTPEDPRLRKIMNNWRVWEVAIGISKELIKIKLKEKLGNDFAALRFWAEKADFENWKKDPIGKIRGIGLITFQYLRMQAGIDTSMPDKVIKRAVERDFNIGAEDDINFIKRMEDLSKRVGCSQILICWAIWLNEAGVRVSDWENLANNK
jgi:hypothetical protein